jgi:hypothetical protein
VIESALNRRHFLATGVVGALCSLGGFSVQGAVLEDRIFPLRSVVSSTVSSFASCLFFCENVLPSALSRTIELARADVTPGAFAEERRCAEFFALLAVTRVARRAPCAVPAMTRWR